VRQLLVIRTVNLLPEGKRDRTRIGVITVFRETIVIIYYIWISLTHSWEMCWSKCYSNCSDPYFIKYASLLLVSKYAGKKYLQSKQASFIEVLKYCVPMVSEDLHYQIRHFYVQKIIS